MEKVFSGGCLCGAVRFNAANGGNVHTCSCDICQKHTGAQTVVWIEFPAAPTIAFFTGVFDDPDQSEFAPENHAFDDMKPAWWRHTMREA